MASFNFETHNINVTSLPGDPSQDGTDATGVVLPTGGIGIRGWLSGIYNLLFSGSAKVQVTGSNVEDDSLGDAISFILDDEGKPVLRTVLASTAGYDDVNDLIKTSIDSKHELIKTYTNTGGSIGSSSTFGTNSSSFSATIPLDVRKYKEIAIFIQNSTDRAFDMRIHPCFSLIAGATPASDIVVANIPAGTTITHITSEVNKILIVRYLGVILNFARLVDVVTNGGTLTVNVVGIR